MKVRARVTGHVYDLPETRALALVKSGIYEAVHEPPAAQTAPPEGRTRPAKAKRQDSPPAASRRRRKKASE